MVIQLLNAENLRVVMIDNCQYLHRIEQRMEDNHDTF